MDESITVSRRAFEADDRISRLPDGVLDKIISLIHLRAAISTCVLSSEWRNLWLSLSVINFTSYDIFGDDSLDIYFGRIRATTEAAVVAERTHKFIEFANKVVQSHVGTGVENFRVRFFLHKEHTQHLDEWIKFALKSGSKLLHLMFSDFLPQRLCTVERYDFPCDLFTSGGSSLKNLFMQFCSLRPPPNCHGFSSLELLKLDDVHITDADFQNLLSACPILKMLWLVLCNELVDLHISSPQLRYLGVALCAKLKSIKFSSKSLFTFEYEGGRDQMTRFKVVDAPRLIRSTVYFNPSNGFSICQRLIGFASDLPRLATLFLAFDGPIGWIYNVDLSPIANKFTKVKRMVVFVKRKWDEDLLWLVKFLSAAPSLESFQLHFYECDCEPGKTRQTVNPSKWRHNRLRKVLVSGFTSHPDQLELLSYLLRSSNLLELTIDPGERFYTYPCTWVHRRRCEPDPKEIRRKASDHLSTVPSRAKIKIL